MCLTGIKCRYDGQSKPQNIDNLLQKYYSQYSIHPFCPEQQHLPTPRPPCNIYYVDGRRVVFQVATQIEKTDEYEQGADSCLQMCNQYGIWFGVMKSRSPSCGVRQTYVNNTLVNESGITSALLLQNDLVLIDSET